MTYKESIVGLLEDVVYGHSRCVDKCKTLLRKASHRDAPRVREVFTNLADISKRIELAINKLSTMLSQNALSADELENAVPIVFYVYEIAVEEEQDLWHRYKHLASATSEELEEHFARLNRIKMLAQEILNLSQGAR